MSYHPLYSYRRNLGSYVTEPSARETLSTTNAVLHLQPREESHSLRWNFWPVWSLMVHLNADLWKWVMNQKGVLCLLMAFHSFDTKAEPFWIAIAANLKMESIHIWRVSSTSGFWILCELAASYCCSLVTQNSSSFNSLTGSQMEFHWYP